MLAVRVCLFDLQPECAMKRLHIGKVFWQVLKTINRTVVAC